MKKPILVVGGIFVGVLLIRLILAFMVPEFTYESYFHLRQVEHILETGLPFYQDPLSYGGRELAFLPLFHYLAALFSLFLPVTLVAKILPNLLTALLVPITYLISKKITEHETGSFIAAFIAGFLPILYFTNGFVVNTLFLPLIFISIYLYLNIEEGAKKNDPKLMKYIYIYATIFFILCLTSPLAAIMLIGLGIYTLLSLLEGKKIHREEVEVMLFSVFLYVWVQFLFFKKSLLQEGISFVWQNIPSNIIAQYFPKFSLGVALVLVSIIPFLAGAVVVYRSLFHLKSQESFLLISLVIATSLLTWLRLIRFRQSLAFFSVVLAILFAAFYQDIERYFQKTKISHFQKYLLPVTLFILLLSTVLPAINTALLQDTPSTEEVEAFIWINENTPPSTTVLATLDEGHLVTYYGKRKNLIDDRFMLVDDVETRFQSLTSLYTTRFQTEAMEIASRYNIEYFILTPSAKEKYQLKREMSYITRRCFETVYQNETTIFKLKCKLGPT
ncbi:MAG: hypothetical protein Q7S55_03530 [Nanoarchaeota archaeon]|nr:hypothetical protein [Nanoarchaeota archaeon]